MMTSACNSQQITNNNLEYFSCKVTADDNCKYLLFNHLITKEDYQAITAAPNDSQMNIAIMEYVRAMDLSTLYKFTDLLINIETQQSIGNTLKKGTCACRMLYIHV